MFTEISASYLVDFDTIKCYGYVEQTANSCYHVALHQWSYMCCQGPHMGSYVHSLFSKRLMVAYVAVTLVLWPLSSFTESSWPSIMRVAPPELDRKPLNYGYLAPVQVWNLCSPTVAPGNSLGHLATNWGYLHMRTKWLCTGPQWFSRKQLTFKLVSHYNFTASVALQRVHRALLAC